jgi:hypothetical protein
MLYHCGEVDILLADCPWQPLLPLCAPTLLVGHLPAPHLWPPGTDTLNTFVTSFMSAWTVIFLTQKYFESFLLKKRIFIFKQFII